MSHRETPYEVSSLMSMKKFLVGLLSGLLITSFNSVAVAEEVAYIPPPEAYEGVGGWAVVDPNTGNVHGVIVCTNDVCGPSGSWGGKMPVDYMGCSGCDLRFQTKATDDGNVAGWHGTQTNIDENGDASQSNDGSVKWNSSDNSFTIKHQNVDRGGAEITRKQKLIPEKTASDGKNLHTGIVDIETTLKVKSEEEKLVSKVKQENIFSEPDIISVEIENWRLFNYSTIKSARDSVVKDIEGALVKDGFVELIEVEVVDEDGLISLEQREEIKEPVFVKAVRNLSKKVVEFFNGWFGF